MADCAPSSALQTTDFKLAAKASAGSACHKGKASHVYAAMGLDKKTAAGVIRVSFGPETTFEEIDALCAALKKHKETRFPML